MDRWPYVECQASWANSADNYTFGKFEVIIIRELTQVGKLQKGVILLNFVEFCNYDRNLEMHTAPEESKVPTEILQTQFALRYPEVPRHIELQTMSDIVIYNNM